MLLVIVGVNPAQAGGYTLQQVTLGGFSAYASELSAGQRAQVKATVLANPLARKFICTGVRFEIAPMSENLVVRKRAKAACAYAKQLNPHLSTYYQTKPTKAKSFAGKVLLTVKNPDMSSAENQGSLPAEVCKLQENSRIRMPGDLTPSFSSELEIRGRYPGNATAFPFAPTVLPITGEIDVAYIYLDWADLPGTKGDYDYYKQQAKLFSDFYWMASENKLKFNMRLTEKWFRVPGSYTDYVTRTQQDEAQRGEAPKKQVFYDAAIASVDPFIDFSDIEVVFFVVPTAKSVFFGGPHEFNFDWNGYLNTQERKIYDIATVGDFNIDRGKPGVSPWFYFVHETGHMLGIPHQANEDANKVNAEKYVVSPLGGWDVMAEHGGQRTMTSWLRWLAGWLEDDQVVCITKEAITENYFELSPINEVEGKVESLVIKVNDTKAIVIESRRFDPKFDISTGNSKNGLIAYTVDATKASAQGSQQILSPRDIKRYLEERNTWPDWRELDAIFFQGDSILVDGINIEAIRVGGSGDLVKLSQVD